MTKTNSGLLNIFSFFNFTIIFYYIAACVSNILFIKTLIIKIIAKCYNKQHMKSDLKKDYFWNTIGVFLQNAVSPLLLIVITRINGIYDSGMFSFTFSIAIIFWSLSMWGGRTYQVSDIKGEFSNKSYIMVRLILALGVFFIAIMFAMVNHYDSLKAGVLISLVLFKSVESIADSLHGVMQTNKKLYIAGYSLIFKFIVGVCLFVAVDLMTRNIFLSCVSLLFVNILITLAYDLLITNKLENVVIKFKDINYCIGQAFDIMRRCAPVFIVTFLAIFSLNIPRYFLDMFHREEIGYFGILAMPITLIVLLMSFVLQPNVVNLAYLLKRNDYVNFRKLVNRIMIITGLIGFAILLGTLLFGVQILELIFGVKFSNYWLALIVIVIGGVVNALLSILINMLIVMRRIKAQLFVLLITNIALVFTSIIFIPIYGLLGGVCLFCFVNFIQLAILFVIFNNVLRCKDEKEN